MHNSTQLAITPHDISTYFPAFTLHPMTKFLSQKKKHDRVFAPCALVIPTQMKFVGGILESACRAVGLSTKSCPDNSSYNSLDTWQKCSLGAVDVQDTHFVKIPSRIIELLPLI